MADPAASIKSLYSGIGNFTDSEYDDASSWRGTSHSSIKPTGDIPTSHQSLKIDESNMLADGAAAANSKGGPLSPVSVPRKDAMGYGGSVNEPYLATATARNEPADWYNRDDHSREYQSTNASVVSSFSDYKSGMISSTEAEQEGIAPSINESVSRPLSRNSTTSCLSTTATKDGIEGKRLHKQPQASLFANMMSGQRTAQEGHQSATNTNAASGTNGNLSTLNNELVVNSLPPITINEKIRLMNSESIKNC